MPIYKQIKTPTQTDTCCHLVSKVEMGGDFTTLQLYVKSFATEDIITKGEAPLAWMWEMSMFADPQQIMTLQAIEGMLVEDPSSPFFEGTIVNQATPIERAIAVAIERIKSIRDKRQLDGGVMHDGNWFLSDLRAQAEYTAIVTMAGAAGLSSDYVVRPKWRTMNKAEVDMTPALAAQLLLAGVTQRSLIDDAAQQHMSAVSVSDDPATYDMTIGWPQTFEEYTAMLN